MIARALWFAKLHLPMLPRRKFLQLLANSEDQLNNCRQCLRPWLFPIYDGSLTIWFLSYSALKMDGKPLYEYARSGTPLPRPIEARQSTVHDIELVGWQEAADDTLSGHAYLWPSRQISEAQRASLESVEKLISVSNAACSDAAEDRITPFTLTPASPFCPNPAFS